MRDTTNVDVGVVYKITKNLKLRSLNFMTRLFFVLEVHLTLYLKVYNYK